MSRVLAIDYGTKRVGLAVSDPLRLTAHPLEVLARATAVKDVAAIVEEYEIELVLVGVPKSLGGFEGDIAAAARSFGEDLRSETEVAVEYADERFTSRMAESSLLQSGMKRRDRRETVDMVAAAIILQDYLDAKRRDGNSISS